MELDERAVSPIETFPFRLLLTPSLGLTDVAGLSRPIELGTPAVVVVVVIVVVVAGGILLDGVIGTSVAFDDVAVVICAGAVLGGAGDDETASLSPLPLPLLFKNPPDARIDHFIAEGG